MPRSRTRSAYLERARRLHPGGPRRGPASAGDRPGGGGVHPPRLPRRRPGPAHPCRGVEQGANPRRALARPGRAGAVRGEGVRVRALQHRAGGRTHRPPPPSPSPTATDAEVGKRPVREITGIDPRLPQLWSRRRAAIDVHRGILSARFQVEHGRPPTAVEALHLAQQATLETRQDKHPARSYAEQRAAWRAEAITLLGRAGLRRMLTRLPHPATPPPAVTDRWIAATADTVLNVVSGSRATWQVWHVRAEAHRQARAAGIRRADLPRRGRGHRHRGARPGNGRSLWGCRTRSANRHCCGAATARRCTRWPAPSTTPPARCSRPSSGWSPPRSASTGAASPTRRSISRCCRRPLAGSG